MVLFFIVATTSFSQTIEEFEDELIFFVSDGEFGEKKDIAYKLLEIDELNSIAINYLVKMYGRNNQNDSIILLFDKLIKNNPKSPEPYLIRSRERNAYYAGLTYTQQINFLKEAYKLDSVNAEVIYSLGKIYYELFIQEFSENKKTANLDDYSKNAFYYFSLLCQQNERNTEILRFPLLQLSNYLGNADKKNFYENYKIQFSYFPVRAFIYLPEDWKTNYSVNVIDFAYYNPIFKYIGVEIIDWYSEYLSAFEEPILNDSLSTENYRFLYLRSFNNPIVIRLENRNNIITIYWKMSNGTGAWRPGKIIEHGNKKLTIAEWREFENQIKSINFWSLPTLDNNKLGLDGSNWILEGKKLEKYHVVDRCGGGIIASLCKGLIELTDLKITEKDMY